MNIENAREGRSALIIGFDTPAPVDYGGIYDVMSRAKNLRNLGFSIDYIGVTVDNGRFGKWQRDEGRTKEIFRKCVVLKGKKTFRSILSSIPASALIRRVDIPNDIRMHVRQANYSMVIVDHIKMVPFAMELLAGRCRDLRLRLHNDEAEYYSSVASREKNKLKAFIQRLESWKYRKFQQEVLRCSKFSRFYFISERDRTRMIDREDKRYRILPVAPEFERNSEWQNSPSVQDNSFLFVGNLELRENVLGLRAALSFLSTYRIQGNSVLVCGRCRDEATQLKIQKEVSDLVSCRFMFNASDEELRVAYRSARFFLNFSVSVGGVKTKLIDALSNDLVVITNLEGVQGSGLDDACLMASPKTASIISAALSSDAEYERIRTDLQQAVRSYVRMTQIAYKEEFCSQYGVGTYGV